MATINGTSGNDTLIGTEDPDTITGGGGADTIDGRGGSDTIEGDGGFGVVQVSRTGAAGGNDFSAAPSFSPDGNRVVFASFATNLVAGDTNGRPDIFIRDLTTGAVTRVSVGPDGAQSNGNARSVDAARFSPDGGSVLFATTASFAAADTNATQDLYIKNLSTGALTLVSTNSAGMVGADGGFYGRSSFSPDGGRVVFDTLATNLVAGDTNGQGDVFVKDLATGAVTRVSTNSAGQELTGAQSFGGVFSPNGNLVLFASGAANAVAGDTNNTTDLFIKNLSTGAVTRVSTTAAGEQANGFSVTGVFSPDGTKIAFESSASNLVAGDTNGQTDVFVKDLVTGAVTRVSSTSNGGNVSAPTANDGSFGAQFTPDGASVVFVSSATNLVEGDTNGQQDVFIKNLTTGVVTRVTPNGVDGAQPNGGQFTPLAVSSTGAIAFASNASNLAAGDTNNNNDVFVASASAGGNDVVQGGAGADRINGGAGNDTLSGGEGDDAISGGGGNDQFLGGPGSDTITGNVGGSDTSVQFLGDAGADRVNLGVGDNFSPNGFVQDVAVITAAAATNVRLTFTSAEVGNGQVNDSRTQANQDGDLAVRLQAETGGTPSGPVSRYDDEGISFVAGDIAPGAGGAPVTFDVRDLVSGAARGEQFQVVSLLTSGADTFRALFPNAAYYVNAGQGDDTVLTADGNDFLVGGAGRDGLAGGRGNNSFIGGGGDDVIVGEDGVDTIAAFNVTTDGADYVLLNAGNDIFNVSANSATNVRLSFTSAEVGNGQVNDAGTLANQDGSLAVRLQAETAGTPAGPVTRVDDEGITFVGGAGVTFDVRDLVAGTPRGEAFEVVSLGTSGTDMMTAVQASRPYYFNAGGGDDTVMGADGNDFLVGGAGRDGLAGGKGNNSYIGGGGDDVIVGEDGIDTVAAFNVTTDGADSVNLGGGQDIVNVSANGATNVRLSFISGNVGNGDANEPQVTAPPSGVDGGLAVRLQAETNGTPGGSLSRFDDEGITFVAGAGVTFDVRDFVSGAQRGEVFEVVTLGSAGADTLNAVQASRPYYFNAGAGNDTVTGGDAFDFLVGGGGDDVLRGGGSADSFIGGGGNDTVEGGAGGDTLLGSDGDDMLTGGAGDDTLAGEAGADDYHFRAGDGFDTIIGYDKAAGGDQIVVAGYTQAQTTVTQEGADVRIRFSASDSILLLGATTPGVAGTLVFGSTQQGGVGADILIGQQADDTLLGGAGDDTLYGQIGDDTLVGQVGRDTLWGGVGADKLYGNEDADTLIGEQDADELWGGSGDDALYGSAGADLLVGEAGGDGLFGGEGDDRAYGGEGTDLLVGEAGADQLYGGAGADILVGLGGADLLVGEAGADVFRFDALTDSSRASLDRIADFETGVDRIDLSALRQTANASFALQQDAAGFTIVSVDANGDGIEDFALRVDGAVSRGDFVF